jgi:hypothetical protein
MRSEEKLRPLAAPSRAPHRGIGALSRQTSPISPPKSRANAFAAGGASRLSCLRSGLKQSAGRTVLASNAHSAKGMLGLLRLTVRRLKEVCPRARTIVRGDAGFSAPRLYGS